MRRWAAVILLAAMAAWALSCRWDSHYRPQEPPAPVAVKPFALGAPDVVLLVTGGDNGWMEMCNCQGPMPGGLARRSGLAASYRAAFPNVLLVDIGDAFWIEPDDLRNEFVLRGYSQIPYDAVALGDQEWAASTELLRKWMVGPTKYLSTGVWPKGDGMLPLVRQVTLDRPGMKLVVLDDLRRMSLMFLPAERLAKLDFAPDDGLDKAIADFKSRGYVVVVLEHGDDAAANSVAAMGADLVVRGHTTRTEKELRRSDGAVIAKIGGSDTVGVLAMKLAGGKVSAVEYRAELVDERWPVDYRLIQTYQAYAHAAMVRALDSERKKGLEYVPSAECGRCHGPQYEAWKTSCHAGAYPTLVKAGRTGDPNCVMCHASGFGTEKGFYTYDKTPQLAGVNCQDCHRFNVAEHRQQGFKFPKVDSEVCETCHTPVTNPGFNYNSKIGKVRCPHSDRP